MSTWIGTQQVKQCMLTLLKMSFVVKAKSEVINSFMALTSISVYIVKTTKLCQLRA